ncbi:bifunctional 2-polyprenyl-6-hydroxyphenol methylase/3-demethylubiquinol 3-O-methyltransferase UbiG [Actinoplanes sp. DH11]|uniref:class I SAM-dependent methyltransferase n=1 Tax=Actinoplanes sp. DH11 TaxID=2857011 RepID=UPI001E3F29F3|nr:class I SAM-dependent methyltransferase [Actinoplanes sp. DH11]
MDVARAYGGVSDLYIELFASADKVHRDDLAFIRQHLSGGRLLDLGCGPGHLTAYLHGLGNDVTGIDLTPEFVAHAVAAFPGIPFRLGSMDELDITGVDGVLTWYSLIHRRPPEMDGVLAMLRRTLRPGGTLVIGFFDGDVVAPFDHKVTTAWFWPVDELSRRLRDAGFTEIAREQRETERPDRRHGALAVRAV